MSSQENDAKTKKIKKILIDKELKIADVSRAIRESRRMTTYVVAGERISWRIRHKIADFLNVPVQDIFTQEEDGVAA